MRNFILFTALLLSSFLMNCRQKGDFNPQNHCKHEINKDSVQVLWTAFKFTERVSVKGSFDSIQTSTGGELNFEELLKSTKIQFHLQNIQSNLAERDHNIRQFFIPSIAQDGLVSAQIHKIDGNQALVAIQLNNIQQIIPFDISVQQNTLSLTANLDLNLFQLNNQIQNLSKATIPMHTGADGIPKMWPDLEIRIQTPIYSYCQ